MQPAAEPHSELNLTPAARTIGAYIHDVDLSQPLADGLRQALYQALLDWKVLFFRDQDITTEQHIAFAGNFGELEVHPFIEQHEKHPEVLIIKHNEKAPGGENIWHSDVTWRLQPSLGSVLRCHEIPPIGGDTLFSDMYAAYDGLPADVREAVEGKLARHDFDGFRRMLKARGASEAELEAYDEEYPNPEHPVIRTHPDTGKKAIYVNRAFTREIIGMDPVESERLLNILYAQAAIPEYQCRFQWQPNSIVFWDNRSCQHYAVSDYWPEKRRVERVTIIGDTPFYTPDASRPDEDAIPFKGVLKRQRLGKAGF